MCQCGDKPDTFRVVPTLVEVVASLPMLEEEIGG